MPNGRQPPSDTSRLATPLGERDRAILDFEGSWWLYPEPKDQAIGDYLDMSATRYYQALRRLIDDADALIYAPLVVRRLRRMRNERLRSVTAELGGDGVG